VPACPRPGVAPPGKSGRNVPDIIAPGRQPGLVELGPVDGYRDGGAGFGPHRVGSYRRLAVGVTARINVEPAAPGFNPGFSCHQVRVSLDQAGRDLVGEPPDLVKVGPPPDRNRHVGAPGPREHNEGPKAEVIQKLSQGQRSLPDRTELIVRRVQVENEPVRLPGPVEPAQPGVDGNGVEVDQVDQGRGVVNRRMGD